MARRYVVVDDLTDTEIEGESTLLMITVQPMTVISAKGKPDEFQPDGDAISSTWELSKYTADSLTDFVSMSDLADFVVRMRPLVKLAAGDSEVIRKWVKDAHPEIKVGDKGRIPAEIQALYRREVIQRSDAQSDPK